MVTIKKCQITPAGGGAPDPGYDARYTSLNAWEAARKRNLVTADEIEVAEVSSGGNCLTGLLNIAAAGGWTTDATRYIIIRAAVGHEHNGVWDTNKAYGLVTNNMTLESWQCIRVERMQLMQTHTNVMINCYVTPGLEMILDSCLIIRDVGASAQNHLIWTYAAGPSLATLTVKNCICLAKSTSNEGTENMIAAFNAFVDHKVYNCTMINSGGRGITVSVGTTQNTYWKCITGGQVYLGTVTKGANDATFNAEAVTANLRNIPYSTATFLNVTAGSENLRLTVSAANKLIDNGANLTAQGITTDIIGTARPQSGAFDIGAFENDVPVCWNYTARYRDSNKLFKASGSGKFPNALKVPSNIDKSTGRMVDDGVEIDPKEYEIV